MKQTNGFFIEVLDNGFVVQSGATKSAIETRQSVEAVVLDKVKSMMSAMSRAGTNNLLISISVDLNVPSSTN